MGAKVKEDNEQVTRGNECFRAAAAHPSCLSIYANTHLLSKCINPSWPSMLIGHFKQSNHLLAVS